MRGRIRFNGGPRNLETAEVSNIFEPIWVPIMEDPVATFVNAEPVEYTPMRVGEYRIDPWAAYDIRRWLHLKDKNLIPFNAQPPYSAVPFVYHGEV